ncbi:reverse transcriptase zinc-binding domain-containing protein [Tanacetum coccineum]
MMNGVCQWPAQWVKKYQQLSLQNSIILDKNKCDKLVWRSKKGKECNFTVRQAYEDLRSHSEDVQWGNLVWFSQNIPKNAFILWMAIQNKLSTQDKIKSWGSLDIMMCPLCKQDMDSHRHLFFKCGYAEDFLNIAMAKMGVTYAQMDWNDFVNHIASLVRLLSHKVKKIDVVLRVQKRWNVSLMVQVFSKGVFGSRLSIGKGIRSGWIVYDGWNRECVKDEPSWSNTLSNEVRKGLSDGVCSLSSGANPSLPLDLF